MARPVDVPALVEGVLDGSRTQLARAITLVESSRADHRAGRAAAADGAAAGLAERRRSKHGQCRRRPARRDQRRARRREVDVHRGARHPAHRGRAPGGRARGRPVVDADQGLDPRRQDPDGEARRRRERVRPAVAERGHARRGGPRDPRDDRADGGRRLRRRARRDGRRRPVRGGRGRDGGHVPAAHDRAHGRRAAGDQEGHPGDRRRRSPSTRPTGSTSARPAPRPAS